MSDDDKNTTVDLSNMRMPGERDADERSPLQRAADEVKAAAQRLAGLCLRDYSEDPRLRVRLIRMAHELTELCEELDH